MPTYRYGCPRCGVFERYLPMSEYKTPQTCECGEMAEKLITIPAIWTKPDICYDSPIDGRPITSEKARQEDLARSNCVPYDPEIKTDYQRRIEREERLLDKAVDETVEKQFSTYSSRQMEKLESELKSGLDVEPVRMTADLKPIKTEIVKNG